MQIKSGHGRERLDAVQAPAILALETSTAACSVALSAHDTILEDHRIVPREHNRLILPMVDALLNTAGIDRADLTAVAFGRGPGSFTGVRIAAGVAQGVSLGLGIPVVSISSLAALAQATLSRHPNAHYVLATLRSRADEVYVGGYENVSGHCRSCLPESVVNAHDLPGGVDAGWWVVGDAVAHFEASIAARGCHADAGLLPTARAVLTLAQTAITNGDTDAPADALPVYLQGTRPWRKIGD
jgi:tRNA threonylcarbamoyladenosine biosynthesis protein TsaB